MVSGEGVSKVKEVASLGVVHSHHMFPGKTRTLNLPNSVVYQFSIRRALENSVKFTVAHPACYVHGPWIDHSGQNPLLRDCEQSSKDIKSLDYS